MNIHTGEILGIGSDPTYNPTVWTKTMSNKEYESLAGEEGANRSSTGRSKPPGRPGRRTSS